jgi:aryl-alcohol dehydrogenase-like predicted oxidoreductase
MEYRILTGTGARVSRLCLGTMTFGRQADETASIAMVDRALDAGINFFDTAELYNAGLSEAILGKALEGKRDRVVLVSKVRRFSEDYSHKDQGLTRWHMARGVEASLKRLRTDCLDVLLFHHPDYGTPIEESLSAADQLVRQGKILYYGICNQAAWQVCRAIHLAQRRNLEPPTITQVPYNLLARGIEQELLPFCREYKVGVMVYNPLAAGLLTGKHDFSKPPAEGTRFQFNREYYDRYWLHANFQAVGELAAIAQRAGKTLVQLALQWLVSQEGVDAVILGASRLEQLEENTAAAEGRLDQETLAACDEVWKKIKGPSFQYNR